MIVLPHRLVFCIRTGLPITTVQEVVSLKKIQKPSEKKIPKHLFSPERGSYSDCSLRVGQNCQYLTFGALFLQTFLLEMVKFE